HIHHRAEDVIQGLVERLAIRAVTLLVGFQVGQQAFDALLHHLLRGGCCAGQQRQAEQQHQKGTPYGGQQHSHHWPSLFTVLSRNLPISSSRNRKSTRLNS